MGQGYWILEYAKVLVAYGFCMYVWPMVVFERHLAGKSRTYRYSFCLVVSVMVVNTLVLLLGFIHVLYPVVVGLLYFGLFFFQLLRRHHPSPLWIRDFRALLAGTLGPKRLLFKVAAALRSCVRDKVRRWWASTRGHRAEYGLLLFTIAFGMLYFSWGAFDEHSYGFGDQYVHHAWVYGLQSGKIFSAGIYPEGMHCFIYLVCTLFGIRLYSGMLFFAGVHISAFLLCGYIFMKEIFHWRYTPLFVLFMFLTFDQLCIDEVFGMSRLCWTLPLEFGFFTQFLCCISLFRFLKRVRAGEKLQPRWRKLREWKKLFADQDLFIFMMSLAASLAIHFYVTIIAFFLCVAVAVLYLPHIFKRGSFLPLMFSVLLGVFMAAAPMVMCFAAGYPLQGSIGWAMNVINGQDNETAAAQAERQRLLEEEARELGVETAPQQGETPAASAGEGEETSGGESAPQESAAQAVARKLTLWQRVQRVATRLYGYGYSTLYGYRAPYIITATAAVFVTAMGMHLILAVLRLVRKRRDGKAARGSRGRAARPWARVPRRRAARVRYPFLPLAAVLLAGALALLPSLGGLALPALLGAGLVLLGLAALRRALFRERWQERELEAGRTVPEPVSQGGGVPAAASQPAAAEAAPSENKRRRLDPDYFAGYVLVVFISVILMFMYTPIIFGLPALVAGSRLCSTEQMVILMLYGALLDYVFLLLGRVLSGYSRGALSYTVCFGIYAFTQLTGIFHGYLYFELTRYNAAVETSNYIMDQYPKQSYTVVSTTDELYQIIDDGYHEELLNFLQHEYDPVYTLPSRYVFLYIEKHPIRYAQYHFASGPAWLAGEKYVGLYPTAGSQCPEVLGGQISTYYARQNIRYGKKLSETASNLEGRTILESKAWRWYQSFSKLYPHSGHVIYEDDDFLCYCFEQNVNSLFSLGNAYHPGAVTVIADSAAGSAVTVDASKPRSAASSAPEDSQPEDSASEAGKEAVQ